MDIYTIDSHIHCGVQNSKQPFKGRILPLLVKAKISECVLFAPVADIYDRYNKDFVDSEKWKKIRKKANVHLEELSKKSFMGIKKIYPYTFVWNDYDIKYDDKVMKGVKWHRHPDEPKYDYKSKECEAFLQKCYKLKLPIIYEETTENTQMFIKRINGRTIVIIPHLGMLNGGYETLKNLKIWDNKFVYADSALAFKGHIEDYVKTYGPDRLLFGSDWPFGDPFTEKSKIVFSKKISKKDKKKLLYKNIQKLLNLDDLSGDKEKKQWLWNQKGYKSKK